MMATVATFRIVFFATFLVTFLGKFVLAKVSTASHTRPSLITDAIANNKTVFYLGIGSNLRKELVVKRGASGIVLSSFVAARVENHRLAFNMRGRKLLTRGGILNR